MKRQSDPLAIAALLLVGDPETIVTRALAGAAFAEAVVAAVRDESPAALAAIIRGTPAYQTPYVAARLLAWYADHYSSWPTEKAIAVTTAALSICTALDPPLPALQCLAEKDAAIALGEAGQRERAEELLDRAERTAGRAASGALLRGQVLLARAKLRLDARRPYEALDLITRAESSFSTAASLFGGRGHDCRPLEMRVWYGLGEYQKARGVATELQREAESRGDAAWAAIHLGNVAQCDAKLGRIDRARAAFSKASAIFDRLDLAVPRARMSRALGRLSIRQTGLLREMRRALTEFDRLGRPDEWVLTELAIAEEMAARGERHTVTAACRHALAKAIECGFAVDAATALCLLHAAARRGEATTAMIGEVAARVEETWSGGVADRGVS